MTGSKKHVHWQYCKDLNRINEVIESGDENWEGLNSAEDIISISFDANHGCYIVFWKID